LAVVVAVVAEVDAVVVVEADVAVVCGGTRAWQGVTRIDISVKKYATDLRFLEAELNAIAVF